MGETRNQEQNSSKKQKYWRILIITFILMIGSSLLASWINKGAGSSNVSEITIREESGYQISAYLYTPKTASIENPAPGVLMIHGLNNEKKFMSNTALELARRGFIVLSMDQPGHGRSTGANYDISGGAVDALKYFRTLPDVDKENIGILGMSQGGFLSATNAAFMLPDDYKSIFYMDSEVNFPGSPDLSRAEGLKNAAFSIGSITELGVMIFISKGSEAPESPMLMPLFGTDKPIEVGKVYGSINDGTARILYQHWGTHPGSTDSKTSIGSAIDWMQRTLDGASDLAPSRQIWPWKFWANALALLCAMLFVFPMGALLLTTPFFNDLIQEVPEYKGFSGKTWWAGALIATAVGPLLYVSIWKNMFFTPILSPNRLWPQTFTNVYMVWAIIVGIISLVLAMANHFLITKKQGGGILNYGLLNDGIKFSFGKLLKALLLAVCTILPVYLILVFVEAVWHTDFRFWIVALLPLTAQRLQAFVSYFIPFLLALTIQGMTLTGFLRVDKGNASLGKEMVVNAAILTLGVIIWLALLYIPLMAGGSIIFASDPLGATAAGMGGIYYIPLLIFWPLAGCLYTFFYRKTGSVFLGSFLVTIFLVWNLAGIGVFAFALN